MTPGAMVFTLAGLVLGAVVVDEVRRIRLALQAVVGLLVIAVTPKGPTPASSSGESKPQPGPSSPAPAGALKDFDRMDELPRSPARRLNGVFRDGFGEFDRQVRAWKRGQLD